MLAAIQNNSLRQAYLSSLRQIVTPDLPNPSIPMQSWIEQQPVKPGREMEHFEDLKCSIELEYDIPINIWLATVQDH